MIDDIFFVVKKDGEYLCNGASDEFGRDFFFVLDRKKSWHYQSRTVFYDAKRTGAEVYMVLPNGREILVQEKDFL